MSDLNFHHLRYFWAVAHEGNLTRAADRLFVSQSAVSAQIKKLEERLGHALFERRGRALELTEAGSIALDYADTLFDLGDQLLVRLSDREGTTRRILRVGALATLSRNFQIGFLKPLLGRDDVEIISQSGSMRALLAAITSHQVDVVLSNVVPLRDANATWVPHRIAEQPVSLVGHPRRVRKGRRLSDILSKEPLLLPSRESSIRTDFDTLTERLGVQPRIAGEIDDMAMLRLMAREDGGLAVVPPIVVKDELAAGALVEVRRLPDLHETFYAITASRRFPNQLLRELLPAGDE